MGDFTSGQRLRAWNRHLGNIGPGDALSGADVAALAQRFDVSPAQIGNAVTVARLISPGGPDRATLEAVLTPTYKILKGDSIPPPVFEPGCYLPEVVNTSVDLEAVAGRLAAWKPGAHPGISLCLYGAPGTGKSEYVRYLAHRMDRPLVVRWCSDILSKWLGESEQNIAQAFTEARTEGAVLLFDEADSFLRDRRDAVRSWEMTQVNEFLQQLETFPGVVACTTNVFRSLDQAALRRFTFKIPFHFLLPAQAKLLFARTLARLTGEAVAGTDADVARELVRIVNLTPGDFAAVARRLSALGEKPTATRLLAELRAEVDVKENAPRGIGFG